MMRWPYENIGVLTTRAFRNLLNKIFGDIGADMQEQKDRVDTLINGVEQPSEVVDMHLGRDGQTYPVARDMVLGEIGKTEAAQAQTNQDVAAQLADLTKHVDYKQLQTSLYAEYLRKIKSGESVIIACRGTSLTYGFDQYSSDKRSAYSDPTCYQTVDPNLANTQASKTYPESLQEFLNTVYGNGKIAIHNLGRSGSRTEDYFTSTHGLTEIGSHLSLLEWGTNDARVDWTTIQNSLNNRFIPYYRKIIERELDRGSACIILTPFKCSADEWKVEIFRKAVCNLGEEYGIPVIDTTEMLANYSKTIYSDGIHLNGTGYTIMAAKICALLIGNLAKMPKKVKDGANLLTRDYLDSCFMLNGKPYQSASGYPTPDEIVSGAGIFYRLQDNTSRITYAFYSDEEKLLLVPQIYFSNSSGHVQMDLDFNVPLPKPSDMNEFDQTIIGTATYDKSMASLPGETAYPAFTLDQNDFVLNRLTIPKVICLTKGWHTVSLSLPSSADAPIDVLGVKFVSYENYLRLNKSIAISTHKSYTESYTVSSLSVKQSDLIAILGINPFKTGDSSVFSPIKISLYNWDQSIFEYCLTLTQYHKLTAGNRVGFESGTSNDRTIASVSYDSETDLITFNFSGNLTIHSIIYLSSLM